MKEGTPQDGRRYQNPVLVGIVLLISGISVAMIQYKVPTIMTNLMGLFSMDASTASWLMSIFTLVSIFVALPAGALAQRFGAKRMLIIACGIAIAGSLIGLASDTSPMLIASRAVEGAALTILTTCGPIIVQQNVSPDKVGTSMGIWGIWGCLGSTVAAVLTPPDVVSQIVLAVPIVLLYQASITICRRMEKRRMRAREAEEGPDE